MKIQLIGYSGSGKSTLASILGEHYGLSVCLLYTIQFLPNFQVSESLSSAHTLEQFLAQHDGWIIDGNYSKYLQERRLKEADLIIFMDFPLHLSLYRVLKRYWHFRGKTRSSMAQGCPEKLDWEFLW